MPFWGPFQRYKELKNEPARLSGPDLFVRPGGVHTKGARAMQYAILCYHSESTVCAWTKEEDEAVMAKLAVVQERLTKEGRLGPVARLMPTTAATTLRKHKEPAVVIDGPFAETKEQLLGFYIVNCQSLEEALGIARELGQANPGGSYEIRPVAIFRPGSTAA
jgi:hypothetical protein